MLRSGIFRTACPGLASRLPILFSEGVSKGRIDPCTFVRLTAANPARLFGLYPRKGTIAPGADADLVLWDAKKSRYNNQQPDAAHHRLHAV